MFIENPENEYDDYFNYDIDDEVNELFASVKKPKIPHLCIDLCINKKCKYCGEKKCSYIRHNCKCKYDENILIMLIIQRKEIDDYLQYIEIVDNKMKNYFDSWYSKLKIAKLSKNKEKEIIKLTKDLEYIDYLWNLKINNNEKNKYINQLNKILVLIVKYTIKFVPIEL